MSEKLIAMAEAYASAYCNARTKHPFESDMWSAVRAGYLQCFENMRKDMERMEKIVLEQEPSNEQFEIMFAEVYQDLLA